MPTPPITLTCDIVSGFSEQVDDGSPIWAHADYAATRLGSRNVERHTCGADLTGRLQELKRLQDEAASYCDRPPPSPPRLPRPQSIWVVYSYGCARLFKCLLGMPEEMRPTIDCLIIIAGVNRIWDGQTWEGCWQVPACVRAAYAFCAPYRNAVPGVMPVLPENCPIRNGSSVRPPPSARAQRPRSRRRARSSAERSALQRSAASVPRLTAASWPQPI